MPRTLLDSSFGERGIKRRLERFGAVDPASLGGEDTSV